MIIAYLKSHVKFYLIPLIFLLYALPIQSEQSQDPFAATNLIDDQLRLPLTTQGQPLNTEHKLKENTQPRSLWSSATRLVKHGLKFRRQIFVRPSTPQHFNRSLTVFLTTFNAGGSNRPQIACKILEALHPTTLYATG
uniref:Uncharacterized protein n=1 Tax=Ditylenchus dipsaci TaxID=166011 RepID=A0A915CM41_9BILA